jgi:hypothetical protein
LESFSELSFENLPEQGVPPAPSLLTQSNFDHWQAAATALTYGILNPMTDASRSSIATIGEVSVLNTALVYGDEKDGGRDWTYSPALLGKLKSGQPVAIFLLGADQKSEGSIILGDQVSFVKRALLAVLSGHAGRFYGFQRLSSSCFGMIMELPPPGLPLQFGGVKNFTLRTYQQVFDFVTKLTKFSGAGNYLDLRIYVTNKGDLFWLPTRLGHFGNYGGFYRPSANEARRLAGMGYELNEQQLDMLDYELLNQGAELTMFEYLERLTEQKSVDDSDFAKLLSRFDQRRLLRVAQNKKAFAQWAAIRHADQPESELQSIRTTATKVINLIPNDRRLYGPDVVEIDKNGRVHLRVMEAGQTVVIMVTDIHRNSWVRSDEFNSRTPAIGTIRNIERDEDFQLKITMDLVWMGGHQIQRQLVLSEQDWSALSSVIIDKDQVVQTSRHLINQFRQVQVKN